MFKVKIMGIKTRSDSFQELSWLWSTEGISPFPFSLVSECLFHNNIGEHFILKNLCLHIYLPSLYLQLRFYSEVLGTQFLAFHFCG